VFVFFLPPLFDDDFINPVDGLRYLSGMFNHVLILTVNPGFDGKEFIPEMLQRIRDTHMLLEGYRLSDAIIQVDGSNKANTIAATYATGARDFVAGTAIFGYPVGIRAGISALRKSLTIIL
jgi:ribulose-phosphate 3-epimerase